MLPRPFALKLTESTVLIDSRFRIFDCRKFIVEKARSAATEFAVILRRVIATLVSSRDLDY